MRKWWETYGWERYGRRYALWTTAMVIVLVGELRRRYPDWVTDLWVACVGYLCLFAFDWRR